MNINQRRNRRKKIQVTTQVKYLTESDEVKSTLGQTIDLSKGGVQLELPRLSEIEQIRELRLDLPDQPEQIVTDGQIKWRSTENGPGTVGIQFTSLTSSEQEMLAEYLGLPDGDEIIEKGSLLRFQQLKQNLIDQHHPNKDRKERIETTPPRRVYSLTNLLDISPSQLSRYIADHLNVEYVSSLSRSDVDLQDLTESFCQTNNIVPVQNSRGHRILVLSNPFKHVFFSEFNDYHNSEFVHFSISEPDRIHRLFEKSLERKRTPEGVEQNVPGYLFVPDSGIEPDLQEVLTLSDLSPQDVFQDQERSRTVTRKTLVIRMVNMILTLGADNGFRHLELVPNGETLELGYKRDEMRHTDFQFTNNIADLVVTRIKIISDLSLTSRQQELEGRFYILLKEQKYRVDVSIVPIQTGEKAILNIERA